LVWILVIMQVSDEEDDDPAQMMARHQRMHAMAAASAREAMEEGT
jgi:hypothetical protein